MLQQRMYLESLLFPLSPLKTRILLFYIISAKTADGLVMQGARDRCISRRGIGI